MLRRPPTSTRTDPLLPYPTLLRSGTEGASTFRRKAPIAVVAAEEENERHRAGRRARREGTVETVVDPAAIIAATAASLSVSDILRWPADDQVSEYRTPDLYAIGLVNGGEIGRAHV